MAHLVCVGRALLMVVPAGSVDSHSVQAVPKGLNRGLKMENKTPVPLLLQKWQVGALFFFLVVVGFMWLHLKTPLLVRVAGQS